MSNTNPVTPEQKNNIDIQPIKAVSTPTIVKPLVSGSNSTLYSKCCDENPILRKKADVEYYECPYCKEDCEVEWQEDEFPDYCH